MMFGLKGLRGGGDGGGVRWVTDKQQNRSLMSGKSYAKSILDIYFFIFIHAGPLDWPLISCTEPSHSTIKGYT